MERRTTMAFVLATRFLENGMAEAARSKCAEALVAAPDDAPLLNLLGAAEQRLGRRAEAEECFRRAVAADPGLAEAHFNLGVELRHRRHDVEATACFRAALAVAPDLVFAWHNLGNALKDMGAIPEAMAAYDAALSIDPDFLPTRVNRLYTENYRAGASMRSLLDEAREVGRRVVATAAMGGQAVGSDNAPDPERRLRIGYVSGDFHAHPIGFFMRPVLHGHDIGAFDVHCYDNRGKDDRLTTILKEGVPNWRVIDGLSDAAVGKMIRDDGIDILIDLSGYTARGRPGLMACRNAPVQIAWIGAVSTTGLGEVDVFLGDAVGVRPEEEAFFTERVVRMPHGWLCYDPPPYAPPVAPPPCLTGRAVTFGCLNNLAKIDAPTMALWARILHAAPDARLLLRNTSFGDGMTRDAVARRFADLGVGAQRLDLLPPVDQAEALASYAAIDIALDPLTYSGGLTTCEALWMGVPVITRGGGPTFASRHSESHLRNAGFPQWIATDEDDYARRALGLAADRAALGDIRRSVRGRMAASPLRACGQFTRDLEAVYRRLWREWCAAR